VFDVARQAKNPTKEHKFKKAIDGKYIVFKLLLPPELMMARYLQNLMRNATSRRAACGDFRFCPFASKLVQAVVLSCVKRFAVASAR
jgi:hypothetical protein